MTLTDQIGALTQRVAQELNGKAPLTPEVTRILSYSNGGIGAPIGTGATISTANCSFRMIVKPPVTTTRWRIKFRNFDTYSGAPRTAITGKKVVVGLHDRSSSSPGAESGNFVGGTATTIIDADFAILGNGDWTDPPWVEEPEDQLDGDVEHVIAMAWSNASSVTMQTGIGRAWYWSNVTSAVTPSTTASSATNQASYIPIDWVIEYESTSRKQAWLFIGDSIPEGTAGGRGAAISPTSLYRSPANQWARRAGILVQNHSLYGITAQTLANPSNAAWTRQDTSQAEWAGAVISLVANDVAISRNLAQIQPDMMSVISNTQARIGAGKPIYVVNVMPVNGFNETARTGYNNWLAQLPTGVADVVDVDKAMRSSSGSAIDAAMVASDGVHPSWQGQGVLAAALTNTVKTLP